MNIQLIIIIVESSDGLPHLPSAPTYPGYHNGYAKEEEKEEQGEEQEEQGWWVPQTDPWSQAPWSSPY